MIIFEPQNRVEVTTPKGDGFIWLVTEFGTETDTIYTIIIKESGEMWQMTHNDIKAKPNWTFNHK
jgi:hypothetical protein